MLYPMIDHADFSVVVKNRAPPPKPWRWEIYRAGRTSPIERSEAFFQTMPEANRAGRMALGLLLSEYPGCRTQADRFMSGYPCAVPGRHGRWADQPLGRRGTPRASSR